LIHFVLTPIYRAPIAGRENLAHSASSKYADRAVCDIPAVMSFEELPFRTLLAARRVAVTFLLVSLAALFSGCGLSLFSDHSGPEFDYERDPTELSQETTTILSALGIDSSTQNLESLEASAELKSVSSTEGRALALSELWFRHAADLSVVSPAGSLAGYLRSADIALEALLDDGCSSAFNSHCPLLNTKYSEATRAVVEALKAESWKAPDISRTKYNLMVKGGNGPLFLSDWEVAFAKGDSNALQPSTLTRRPGVGLAAAGCRTFTLSKDDVGVCSPLTFVLSFSPLKTRDKTDAVLSVYDAYQREVVAVKGRDLPLAADFATATSMLSLSSNEDVSSPPQLNCLSVPTATTTSVIALAAAASLERYRDMIGQLVSDPSVRSRFSFCFFDSSSQNAIDLSIDLQEVIYPKHLASAPGPVVLLALDDAGRKIVPRAIKSVGAGSSQLKVSGVVVVQSQPATGKELEKLRKLLKVKKIPRDILLEERSTESLRKLRQDVRSSLLKLPAPDPTNAAAPAEPSPNAQNNQAEPSEEELEVSSVL
jgi:hypothetical protein